MIHLEPRTHYRIERSKTGTRWINLEAKIAIGMLDFADDQYSHTNDDLLEYQEWYYRVSAINSEGASTASNAPKLRTEAGDVPEPHRTLFAGINPESPTIWLYWDAPQDDTSTTDVDESDLTALPSLAT